MALDFTASARVHAACALCLVQGCIVRRSDRDEDGACAELITQSMAVMPGSGSLFNAGDRLRAVFLVRGGYIKTFTLDPEGKERVRGFYLPGELIGLDAFGHNHCPATAAAAIPSQVCVVPLVELQRAIHLRPELARHVLHQISRELSLALAMAMAMAGDFTAEQRMAAFLLDLQQRLGTPGVLRLTMGQREIGSYLRMANETVCRVLTEFKRRGWLSLQDRTVQIPDERRLGNLAEAVGIIAAKPTMARAA